MARPRMEGVRKCPGAGFPGIPQHPFPAMQLNSRPSQRKQRQAKDVLAKGVVVSVLRLGTASETDGVCALEAVQ